MSRAPLQPRPPTGNGAKLARRRARAAAAAVAALLALSAAPTAAQTLRSEELAAWRARLAGACRVVGNAATCACIARAHVDGVAEEDRAAAVADLSALERAYATRGRARLPDDLAEWDFGIAEACSRHSSWRLSDPLPESSPARTR